MDPNPDYDASDEIEYGINWWAWILRGVSRRRRRANSAGVRPRSSRRAKRFPTMGGKKYNAAPRPAIAAASL